MYKQYYGLTKNPFELAPDSGTLFLSETHKEGLAILKYGILSRKGFLLLTGGVGTGKSTLVTVLEKSLIKPFIQVCVLANPILTSSEFLFYIASKLGLPFSNKVNFLKDFSGHLEKCAERHQRVLLIIDEAHVLSVELLEEIRLLSNQASDGLNVLSIFLVGQPELLDRLADERLLPLRQRIGIRFHLDSFSLEDTIQYIHFRLNEAGAKNTAIFTEKALQIIHEATRGNPRLINILCDHALLSGFSLGQLILDDSVIQECVGELHLPGDRTTFNLLPISQPKIEKRNYLLFFLLFSLIVLAVILVFSDELRNKAIRIVTQNFF
jgi:general secretion pathway protein A